MISLRPYQNEAIAAIEESVTRGIQRPLVALPTGTGKTVLFAELIKRRPGRSLILAHRDELLRQAGDKINGIMPGADIGYVKAEEDDHNSQIVIASVQTLARENRLDRLRNGFKTIVVDEAHHAAADTYRRILERLKGFEKDGPIVLGVTATPERGDGVGLNCVFQEIVYQKNILEMITSDFLCDIRAIEIKLKADFNQLRTSHGDFVDSEVEKMLKAADAPKHVVEAFTEHAADRKAIVFTPTVALAHEIARQFAEAGYEAEALDGTTPADERKGILERLKSGATQIVCNCGVLTEGFDEPSVNCIVIARPTKSKTLYIQMIGRGTRKWRNDDCLILDVVGISERLDLQTASTLFGLPPGAIEQKALTEYLAEQAAIQLAEQEARGQLVAHTVDLFKRSRVHWLPKNDGRHVLSTGQGLIIVCEDHNGWRVELKTKESRETLIDKLTQEYAMGFAEDEAKAMGAGSLIDPDAKWRQQPASEKQLEKLTAWKIPFETGITKGTASDLMTLAIADFKQR